MAGPWDIRPKVPPVAGELTSLLEGVRVLSIAEQYPGPYATLVLSDLGADVVQVERPDGGDPSRQFAGFYEALNRNKRSVTLDLKRKEDVDSFLRLATEADVVLEGFRPGTVDRLGVGYTAVKELNADVVYVSISGYGQEGPYRDRPGHDLAYQALAGLLSGAQGTEPRSAAGEIQIGDLAAGMFALIATMAGLFHRERTGSGLYADVSMFDVLISMMTGVLVPTLNDMGGPTFTEGPAYGTFVTADGRAIVVAIAHEDKFWQRLCGVLGLESTDLSTPERLHRKEELRVEIARVFATQNRDTWIPLLVEADIPFAPVHALEDLKADEHIRARGLLVDVVGSNPSSARTHVRQPLVIPGFSCEPQSPAPELGEHTAEVIGEPSVVPTPDVAGFDAAIAVSPAT